MESPYQSPVEPSKEFSGHDLMPILEPIYRRRTWIRVLGVSLILLGGAYCITIIGAIFGIPMLICGVYLMQAAKSFERGFSGDSSGLYEGSDRLSLAIVIGAVMMAILAIILVIYIFAIILVLVLSLVSATL